MKRPFWIRHLLWTPELNVAGPAVFAAHRAEGSEGRRGEASAGGDRKEQHREGHRSFLLGAGDRVLTSLVNL